MCHSLFKQRFIGWRVASKYIITIASNQAEYTKLPLKWALNGFVQFKIKLLVKRSLKQHIENWKKKFAAKKPE